MESKDYREHSRARWMTTDPSMEAVQVGALQRIADATEKMAQRYEDLVRDRDQWKRVAEVRADRISELKFSIRSLRGVITRMRGGRR